MKISELRIYAEVLEQGLDFKKYITKILPECSIKNIYTKKLRSEIVGSDSIIDRIRKVKDVDILLTSVCGNEEIPVLMVEYSTAVPADDHKLGKLCDKSLVGDVAYKKGIDQFVVDLSNLKQILDDDKDLRDNVIVAVSSSSNDGTSGIGNPSRPNANSDLTVIRDDLNYFADIIFSATESTIKYFLGEGPLSKEQVIHKYGRLKPCVHGCDAHKNSDIFAPNNNKYCWIKADCTFEGLKQIVYEPKERVKICDNYPERKRDYNVIDKITISDERFSPAPIVFNPKIQTMSPGKKALVLLKLLINLANSDCPILIDQPEDDLDNRSIYYELVDFLRQKKHDRQIIIVTHNANIVLGSDSEEIIVANQRGANSPNEIYRFEYRSGSIENNSIIKNNDGSIRNGILNQKGIQGHICEILEGGKEAFNVRKDKYTLV